MKNRNIIIARLLTVVLFMIGVSCNVASQIVLLEREIAKDTVKSKWGPNRSNYANFHLGYGFYTGQTEGTGSIVFLKSGYGKLSARYKKKIFGFYALGLDLHFTTGTYWISQNANKSFPDSVVHKSQSINQSTIGLEIFNRISFSKRGDIQGFYIDFGAYGNILTSSYHKTKDKNEPDHYSKSGKTVVKHKRLSYLEFYQYGLSSRIGYNRITLFASYRLSNMMRNNYQSYPELPRLIIGLEIALLKMNQA